MIGRGKKVWVGEGEPQGLAKFVRSRRNGWHLEHKSEPPKGVRTAAKTAVKALGYDFGAVDLLVREGGEVVVLEVNSAPALRDDYTWTAYTNAIRKTVEGEWDV